MTRDNALVRLGRPTRAAVFLSAVAVLAHCTLETSIEGQFTCSDGVCPQGYVCGADAKCHAPGSPPDAADLADAAPADAPPPDAANPCRGDSVISNNGHCWALHLDVLTWPQARDACLAQGGHLAVITSADENLVVRGLFQLQPLLQDAWLAGSDQAAENVWTWSTNDPFTFANWRVGEPNNGGMSGLQEDCLIIELDTLGTWDDRPCATAYPYICESL